MDASNGHPAAPSEWVVRWSAHIAEGGRVLDVACGSGRHTLWLAGLGYRVGAVDRDVERVGRFACLDNVTVVQADLERDPWPFHGERFDGIVVTNYLHRPLFPLMLEALAPAGVLIYETFARGNERFGRPANPAFLLEPGELLAVARGRLRVLGYEDIFVTAPRPARVQRICAVRDG